MRFALNHITAPRLSLPDFIALADRLGIRDIEIRNDLPDVVGTLPPAEVRRLATDAGVTILTINALYPFNRWSGDLPDRAARLADYAAEAGAAALVLCALNDGTPVPRSATVEALGALAPLLAERGLTGLVEPLGFPVSALRMKAEALTAIAEVGARDRFALLHDTFHHHLAGEAEFFPDRTRLVHVSGVTDPAIAVEDMLDAHRVLVDSADRLDNLAQLRALAAAGYAGPVSFEPFAPEVHDLDDIEAALRVSMALLRPAMGAA